jgi:hypothetical protein
MINEEVYYMNMRAFWDIVLYSLVEVDRRFGDVYCLQHQGDDWRQ